MSKTEEAQAQGIAEQVSNKLNQVVPLMGPVQSISENLDDQQNQFANTNSQQINKSPTSNPPTIFQQQSASNRSDFQSQQEGEVDKTQKKLEALTNQKYSLSPWRFVQLFLYIVSDLSNSLSIYTFQTIGAQVAKIYDLDPFLVSLNLSFYSLLYPFVSLLANYIIDQRGAAFSVKIGVILTTVGFCLRLLIKFNWGYVLLSCIFCGMGGPLIFNAKCRFQSNWFKAGDLSQITTLSTIITSCNGIVGVLLPGFYFTGYDYKTDHSENFQDGKDLMMNLLIIELIIVLVCAGLSLFFLRNKPAKPPSFVSTLQRENYKEAVKGLIKNTAYLKLNVASMLFVGNTSALAALFSFAIQPWGFNQTDTSYCAAGMVVTGIIGSAINAPLLRKYKKFKMTTIILAIVMFVNVVIIIGILNLESRVILVLFVSLFGGGYQPLVSTTYEYACEVAFPIGEGSAQGFLLGTSSIFGFICITVFGAIVQGQDKSQTYIMLAYLIACLIIGIILIFTSKFNLNRFNTELKNLKDLNNENINLKTPGISQTPQKLNSPNDNSNQNIEEHNSGFKPILEQQILMTTPDQGSGTSSNIPINMPQSQDTNIMDQLSNKQSQSTS
ncbi:hypothetical protein ABPG72_005403 [Tetrahymena utriculariae]